MVRPFLLLKGSFRGWAPLVDRRLNGYTLSLKEVHPLSLVSTEGKLAKLPLQCMGRSS